MNHHFDFQPRRKRWTALCIALAMVAPAAIAQQTAQPMDSTEDPELGYDPADLFGNPSTNNPYRSFEYYGPYWDNLAWYGTYDFDDPFSTEYEWDERSQQWEAGTGDEADNYRIEEVYPNPTLPDPSSDAGLREEEAQSSQSAQTEEGTTTLTGTVDGFRRVVMGGAPGYRHEHALVRIELESGANAVVDLGVVDVLDIELNQGDEVTLKGSRGTIDGQAVFVAEELRTQSDVAYLQRAVVPVGGQGKGSENRQAQRSASKQSNDGQSLDRQASSQAQAVSAGGPSLTLEGQIQATEKVQTGEAASDQETWVQLRFQDGSTATVNLGPNTSLADLDIKQGDRVRIEGQLTRSNGRFVVDARTISVEGETVAEPSGA